MTEEYTAHYRLPIPDFNTVPWHQAWEDSLRAVDEALYLSTVADAPMWANSTQYFITDMVLDPLEGTLWVAKVNHTSVAAPTTFAQTRVTNPTFWQGVSNVPVYRGVWAPATTYYNNDFVLSGSKYAVCLVSHVSAAAFATDEAAGRWSVLIDVGSSFVAINNMAASSVAAAATINLGAIASSRITITGVAPGGLISNFGTTPETFKILIMGSAGNTIVSNANIQLPDGQNIVAAANDIFYFFSTTAGVWVLWGRLRKFDANDFNDIKQPATTTYTGVVELATDAEALAKADTTRALTPSNLNALDASQTVQGFVELATDAEAQAMADGTRALTPLNLAALDALETRQGLIEIATVAELLALTDATRAITPGHLSSLTASATQRGIVELATIAETQVGTDATRAVTPSGLAGMVPSTADVGLTRFATIAETQALGIATAAVTPSGLGNVVATTTTRGLVELADDAETAAFVLASKAVTPDGLGSLVPTTVQRGIVKFATPAEAEAKLSSSVALNPSNLEDVTATRAEIQTETNAMFVPATMTGYTPSAPKGFAVADSAGNLQFSYNTSGVVDSGTGVLQVAVAEDMTNTLYAVVSTAYMSAGGDTNHVVSETLTTAYTVRAYNTAGAAVDPTKHLCMVMGTRI